MIEYNLDIATVDQLNRDELIQTVNYLIVHNFEKLIYALYRIDVDEAKIKYLLETRTDTNAAILIADAIIQRQIEKKLAREKYKQPKPDESEDVW
jgi:hypothetical protein